MIVSAINSTMGKAGGSPMVSAGRVLGGPVPSSMDGTLMVQGGESILHSAPLTALGQPNEAALNDAAHVIVGNFSIPARGINWGELHPRNAVDIAGHCGAPLYAASAGEVREMRTEGWNGGYGVYVDIDHGDGVVTRYAHAEKILVVENQMVVAGEMIAVMGKTGESTGCHVHFEVRGGSRARNPFAKK